VVVLFEQSIKGDEGRVAGTEGISDILTFLHSLSTRLYIPLKPVTASKHISKPATYSSLPI